jgi:hypothetical protein
MALNTKVVVFARVDKRVKAAMERLKATTGIPEWMQVQQALSEWLNEQPSAWLPTTKSTTKRKKGGA